MTVRLVKCNSLDLNLFQFDYDLTFAVFFLNADKTVYARYGTRTGHDADKDVALEGLAATMNEVLKIHAAYPKNKSSLAGKQPKKSKYKVPEDLPKLRRFKSKLDYKGAVAKSCIHCHQVRDAQRFEYRKTGKQMPDKLLFPYPKSETVGLKFDKKSKTTLAAVLDGSPAHDAKLRRGDGVVSLGDTTVASEADVHWILHQLDNQKRIKIVVDRDGEQISTTLNLPAGWRKQADITWRPTSWELRRMATGGLSLKPISQADRKRLGIADDKMALRAVHVGRYGDHARAMRAGIRKGDIIIAFDGKTNLLTENMINEYAVQQKKPGQRVEIKYLRGKRERTASIRLQ